MTSRHVLPTPAATGSTRRDNSGLNPRRWHQQVRAERDDVAISPTLFEVIGAAQVQPDSKAVYLRQPRKDGDR